MTWDTVALIGRAHQGDKEARDILFHENTGLIYSVAHRFLGRGAEMEDLFQIGSIGLLKAVDKFDLSYDVKFSTYAVPMIAGEIKRFLRDDGMLKVSRSIKENQYRIYKMREKLEKNLVCVVPESLGGLPVTELAEELGMTPEEIAMASDAATEVESIYRPIHQGEGTELQLLDKLPEKENRQERILDKIFLEELLNILGTEERRLICMRYFCDMTQTEVAKRLGISQVQVSRMEKRILHRLKKEIQDKTEV
jgi:RNA polymerase sporulation-specific sigma factor